MELHKNGYVVATLNTNNKVYHAWPLADIADDKTAESLTEAADSEWFCRYDMQEIIPDLNFAKMYLNYCKSIHLPAKLLLFESLDNSIVVDDEVEVKEVLGFDCIGTVYYSYLQSENDCLRAGNLSKTIRLNKNGLSDCIEDIMEFIDIRNAEIESGINLENFWKGIPVKISIIEED